VRSLGAPASPNLDGN